MCERRPVEKTIELLVLVLAIKIGHLSLAAKVQVTWTVVVAQFVERSLPTLEIRGSNPNNGKLYLPIVH